MIYRWLVIAHLLGAAVWVGGHLVLALTVLPRALASRDPSIVLDFEAGFERLGLPALALQVATGLWLALHWAPPAEWLAPASWPARLVAAKLGLLGATAALAAHARLRLIPRLTPERLPVLAWHIVGVTALAVAFVVLGAGIRLGGLA